MNLLISGLGGSLFPYLDSRLKKNHCLYYVDSEETLTHIYRNLNFVLAPLVTDKYYPFFIEALIRDYKIDAYIPLIDEEILLAHEIKEKTNDLILISPTKEFCKLALNKFDLMNKLSLLGISNIKSFPASDFSWKEDEIYFLKPTIGRGSRGVKKIETYKQFEAYFVLENANKHDYLIQDYIQGVEYTVGVLFNLTGDILSISSKKIIKKRGITIHAVTENNVFIDNVIFKIKEKLNPKGPINLQLFIDNKNNIRIFEINPRFSTTSIMSYAGGVNEIDLFLKYFNKSYLGRIRRPKENIHLFRRWENIFYEN